MKSTFFDLEWPDRASDRWDETDLIFDIPTLPAYATEYSEFSIPNQLGSGLKILKEGKDYFIENDKLIWKYFEKPFFVKDASYRLIIHYHGIRDYALLFPFVQDNELKERLGKFYKEAEVAFDNGTWLCYALMCGAIYEGMLYALLKSGKVFAKLIEQAEKKGIITTEAAKVMNSTRKMRNLVHGKEYKKSYVTRLQAMDMRKVMDTLIKTI